jgi:hypothetical protein
MLDASYRQPSHSESAGCPSTATPRWLRHSLNPWCHPGGRSTYTRWHSVWYTLNPGDPAAMSRFATVDEKYAFQSPPNRLLTGFRGHLGIRWKFYTVAILFVLVLAGFAVRYPYYCCAQADCYSIKGTLSSLRLGPSLPLSKLADPQV